MLVSLSDKPGLSLTWGNPRNKKDREGTDLLDLQILIWKEDYDILTLINRKTGFGRNLHTSALTQN